MRSLLAALVVLPLLFAAASVCAAEEESRIVKVGLCAGEPFVLEMNPGEYSGLAFNLWEQIAARLGVKSEFILYRSFRQLLDDARSGKTDIIVGNIAVSHDRAKNLKFSFPWYDDGLRILVTSRGPSPSVWTILQQRGQTGVYAWTALLVAALTLGHALVRRRRDADFPAGWLEGMSLSLYDVVRAVRSGGQLQKSFMGWAGYVIMTVWMLFGFGLLAYVTSTFTSALVTAGAQRGEGINSLNDLPGKRVAVISHSIGEKYMRETGARLLPFEAMEKAVDALMKGDADALVMDAAELEYWVYSNPKMDVEVVGNKFNPYKYAFGANKKHARLMDLVSEEVIRLLDDGTVEGLKDKYFGRVRF